jgi:pyruvate/2-oxoglutarate dehydrogenase complex dihydrolipoamide acyltransferase (E2) component
MAMEIRVPKIAASATKASIGRWFKRIGDPLSLDEPLVDGENVKAGALLGAITEYGSGTKALGTR